MSPRAAAAGPLHGVTGREEGRFVDGLAGWRGVDVDEAGERRRACEIACGASQMRAVRASIARMTAAMSAWPCPSASVSPNRAWQASIRGDATLDALAAAAISRLFLNTSEIEAWTSKLRATSFSAFACDTLLAIGP